MDEKTFKATSIRKGFFNGKPVKFFALWKLNANAWVFAGNNIAPVKIANKSLVKWAMENLHTL